MKMRLILGASVVSLLAIFLLIAGCGDGSEEAATTTTESEAAAEEAVETAAEAAETVAMHACAGGCGMDAVPEDQMTEVDGKWYCAGCAKKVQAEGESHGDG